MSRENRTRFHTFKKWKMNLNKSNRNRIVNYNNNIYQIKSDWWDRGSIEQDLSAIGGIVMAYDLQIGIYKEFMQVKSDRRRNATDYINNENYDQKLRDIVRAILLEEESPLGIKEIIILFE